MILGRIVRLEVDERAHVILYIAYLVSDSLPQLQL
jgi:hypothetical protein